MPILSHAVAGRLMLSYGRVQQVENQVLCRSQTIPLCERLALFGHLLLGLKVFWQTIWKSRVVQVRGKVSSRLFLQRCHGTSSLAIRFTSEHSLPCLLTPGVTHQQGCDCVCVATIGRHETGASFTHLFLKNLDFNLCFSCLCVKQRCNVYSRLRDWELAPWAVELGTGFRRLFLGEIIAAAIEKT